MRWRKRRREGDGAEPGVFVIGAQLAQAREVEAAHRAARPGAVSPLAGLAYEGGAFDFARFAPSPTDEAIRERLEDWQRADPTPAELRDDLTMDDLYTLVAFAKRATARSLREDDPGWATAGVLALPLVACDRVDPRDLIMAAAMVAWALGRTGHDVAHVLGRAASGADEEAAAILRRFADDPPARLDDEWGFRAVMTPAGATLVPSDFERYEPTVDLLPAAFALADALDADRYRADVTVATALPDVWCRGPHHEAAVAALDRARAAVDVRARPAAGAGVSFLDQMFVVWIVEAADAADAEVVAQAALASSGDHVRLALHDGPACAVLIARSTRLDTAALETPTTIDRFVPALHTALRLANRKPFCP